MPSGAVHEQGVFRLLAHDALVRLHRIAAEAGGALLIRVDEDTTRRAPRAA